MDRDEIDPDVRRRALREPDPLEQLLKADGRQVHLLTDDYVADGVLCVFPELLRPPDEAANPDRE